MFIAGLAKQSRNKYLFDNYNANISSCLISLEIFSLTNEGV